MICFSYTIPLSAYMILLWLLQYTVIYDYIIGKTEKLHYHLCQDNFSAPWVSYLKKESQKRSPNRSAWSPLRRLACFAWKKNSHCSGKPPSGHIGRSIRTGSTSWTNSKERGIKCFRARGSSYVPGKKESAYARESLRWDFIISTAFSIRNNRVADRRDWLPDRKNLPEILLGYHQYCGSYYKHSHCNLFWKMD